MPVHAEAGGKSHEVFEHQPDLVFGELVVAVTALLALGQEASGFELGKMGTRRLQRDAGMRRKLRRRQRPPAHQRGQHVGACRIADQRSDESDVWAFLHTSIVIEAFSHFKRA
ncbi:hypothetical protein D3C87_1748060 [compost metagenome]